MFDTLSPDQERLLDQLSEQMRVDAIADVSCSQSAVEAAVARLYAEIGLKPPHLIWCDGPFQLSVMPLLLQMLAFRHKDKKSDDLNIDKRVERLLSTLTEPAWHQALERLVEQVSSTTICALKYEDDPVLASLVELTARFSWSRCGISVVVPLFNLLQKSHAAAVKCLAQSATLGLAAALTSRLYTRPIDLAQAIKRRVGVAILHDQSVALRDLSTSVFGSAKGPMTALYKRAQELHAQIGGTVFEQELAQCLAPQADEKFRKPRHLETDIVMNTAGLLAFGPYDTQWGVWASYSATCYAIISDMLRDQFPKEVRSTLSDLSMLMRCGFAYTPLTRTVFICRIPKISLDEIGRLHNERGPAVEFPDGYKIFAWRNLPVPREVIESPGYLTGKRIDEERNVELRRTFIDKFGIGNYLRETSAGIRDQTELGTLYLKQLPGDEPIAVVRVKNSTPEIDGSFKEYFLRVPPNMKTVREAVAWTFGLKPDEYSPEVET
jgi:hypothetical protein